MRIYTDSDVINTKIINDKSDYAEHQVLDSAVRTSQEGLHGAVRQHLSYLNYTVNQMTPGFKRTNFANYWDGENAHSHPFIQPSVGSFVKTESPLDVFVQGKGYVYVMTEQGPAFGSDGRMVWDIKTKRLLSRAGRYPVLDENDNPIELQSKKIHITKTGEIYENDALLTTLKIVRPKSFGKAKSYNGVLFYTTTDNLELIPHNQREVLQGYYEAAAVPKALGSGDAGRYSHMYTTSAYTIKRRINTIRSSVHMVGQ